MSADITADSDVTIENSRALIDVKLSNVLYYVILVSFLI